MDTFAEVIPLPTAAKSQVRQPTQSRSWRAATKEAVAAGVMVRHPAQYYSPEVRLALAEEQARQDRLAAAGVVKNAPALLAAAAVLAMPPRVRAKARAMLFSAADRVPDDQLREAYRAALDFMELLEERQ